VPLFDYKCNECNKTFEKICHSDVLEVECKFCKKGMAKKQVCAPASIDGGFETGQDKKKTFELQEHYENKLGSDFRPK